MESGIAVTIVLAAAHALRPVLARRSEALLTVVFGVIHGFGFAGTLDGLSLHGSELAVPLLGFNLGLEAAQLAALALLALPIWLVARSRGSTLAALAGIATGAASWTVQRLMGLANPVDVVVSVVAGTPEKLALALVVLGLLPLAVRGRATVRSPRAAPGPRAVDPGDQRVGSGRPIDTWKQDRAD